MCAAGHVIDCNIILVALRDGSHDEKRVAAILHRFQCKRRDRDWTAAGNDVVPAEKTKWGSENEKIVKEVAQKAKRKETNKHLMTTRMSEKGEGGQTQGVYRGGDADAVEGLGLGGRGSEP